MGELYVGQLIQGVGLPMIAVPLIDMFVADVTAARRESSRRERFESIARSVRDRRHRLGDHFAAAEQSGKFGELLSNTGFYPDGRGTSLASLAARMAHTTSDPMFARAQAVQIIAGAARRQAAVLGISDTLAALGWLLFASCLLVVLMAEFGSGRGPSTAGDTPMTRLSTLAMTLVLIRLRRGTELSIARNKGP